MNRYIILFLLCLGFVSTYAQDVRWKLSPILGLDMGGTIPIPLSEMPDDAEATPLIKPTMGIGLHYNLNKRLDLGAEVNYHNLSLEANVNVISQAFWSDDRSYATYFTGEAYTNTELRFIELPVTATYHLGKRWSLVFGAYYSRILKGVLDSEGKNGWISVNKEDTDNAPLPGTQNTSFSFNDDLDTYDLGGLLGYQFKIGERMSLWGRLNVGLKSIFKPEFQNIDYDMYQFRFGTGLRYMAWSF